MSAGQTIPDDTAAHYARLINEAEKMRQAGADALKDAYADLRNDLKELGWDGKNISTEIAAFKGAIAEVNLAEADKQKRDAKDDRIDQYVFVLSRARAPARENVEEFDVNPKLIATVATAMQTEIGRKALVTAVDIMIEREEAENSVSSSPLQIRPETVSELPETANETVGGFPVAAAPTNAEETGSHPIEAANVDGENVVIKSVTGGESAATILPEQATEVRSASTDAPETPGKQCTSVVSKDEAGQNLTGPHSPIAAASQGEAEAPEPKDVSLPADGVSSEGANTGGLNEVDAHEDAATYQAGSQLVSGSRPANPLRPNCLKPDSCGGYGSKHCHSCTVAAREAETA